MSRNLETWQLLHKACVIAFELRGEAISIYRKVISQRRYVILMGEVNPYRTYQENTHICNKLEKRLTSYLSIQTWILQGERDVYMLMKKHGSSMQTKKPANVYVPMITKQWIRGRKPSTVSIQVSVWKTHTSKWLAENLCICVIVIETDWEVISPYVKWSGYPYSCVQHSCYSTVFEHTNEIVDFCHAQ